MIAAYPVDALRLIDRGAAAGMDGVLITLVAIAGSASRAVGTQMAVLADGRHVGSFSGGCIESAIIAEALEVLAQGQPRTVRYGAGSPYIDVRLPCGGEEDQCDPVGSQWGVSASCLARAQSSCPAQAS